MKGKGSIHLIAIISMFFWGMSYIWTKMVYDVYTPITTVFLRLVISSVFLLIAVRFFFQREKIQKRHYALFLFSAVFNPFLYFVGESFGLLYVSSSISSIIIATIPLFTPVFAFIAFRERLSRLNIGGLFVSFIGITIILINKDGTLAADLLGIILLFGAVASAVIFSIFLKVLTKHYKPLTIIAYQNAIGALLFLPLFLINDYKVFMATPPDKEALVNIVLLALFASSLAYILFTRSVQVLGISKANIYTNLIPVFTGVVAYFILNEAFPIGKLIGMPVVIIGVILSQMGGISRKGETRNSKLEGKD